QGLATADGRSVNLLARLIDLRSNSECSTCDKQDSGSNPQKDARAVGRPSLFSVGPAPVAKPGRVVPGRFQPKKGNAVCWRTREPFVQLGIILFGPLVGHPAGEPIGSCGFNVVCRPKV